MSRRQIILEILAIFAIFCLQGMWPVPEVNEPNYLGKAIHYWNPHWAESDWFLQTADAHTVFYRAIGWLALVMSPTAMAWTLRLVTWALLAWSWQRLSAAIVPRAWTSVLTAALFDYLLQHYNMAGEWVVGGAEGKGFSFALIFFALAAMAQGYWNRMWLLLGLATAMHPLVGGWAAIAAGAVWLFRGLGAGGRERGAGGKEQGARSKERGAGGKQQGATACSPLLARRSLLDWIAPGIALVLALPGILPPLVMNRGVAPATVAKAEQIYVFDRISHHLDITKMWGDGFVLPFLAMTACWLLLWKTASDSPAARRLRGFTAAALVIASVGAVLGLWGIHHRAAAAHWLRFYWFRLSDVAVPLGFSLLAVRWFVARKMRLALGIAIAIAAFHAADCAVLRFFADPPFDERGIDGAAWRAAGLWVSGHPVHPIFPRQPRADKLREYADWRDVCRWVADPDHTPPSARFLIPRAAYTFKWYAGRGEVVNWKETPQDAAAIVDWSKRIERIYATGNPPPQDRYFGSLAEAGAARLKQVADEYQADYLVTQVGIKLLPFTIVYKNDSFAVYKMR